MYHTIASPATLPTYLDFDLQQGDTKKALPSALASLCPTKVQPFLAAGRRQHIVKLNLPRSSEADRVHFTVQNLEVPPWELGAIALLCSNFLCTCTSVDTYVSQVQGSEGLEVTENFKIYLVMFAADISRYDAYFNSQFSADTS